MVGFNSDTEKFEIYDGSAWVVITKDYVLKAGDTMTGDLGFNNAGVETANYLGLNTSYVKNGEPVGTFVWNQDRETADLVMPGGVTLQLGQEVHFYGLNQSGVDIPNGTAVMFAGSAGASGKIKIAKAVSDGTYSSMYMMGVTTQAIANGASGKVTFFGEVHDVNTSGYSAGTILYLDPANPGGFTSTIPQAPNLKYAMAATVDSKNNGTLFVRAIYPLSLNELDDVQITSSAANDFVLRNSTNTRWENKSLANTKTTLGLTGTNSGDVTLASPNNGLSLTGQTIGMGTPSSITTSSTNSVTTNTHTHAITGFATGSGSASGTNTGDVSLASPNNGLSLTGQTLSMGTPTGLSQYTSNALSGSSHTHSVSGFIPTTGGSVTGTLNINPSMTATAVSSVINSSGDNGDVVGHYTEVNQKTAPNTGSLFGYRVVAKTTQTVADIQVNSTQVEVNGGSPTYAEGLTATGIVASGATLSNLSLLKIFTPTVNGSLINLNGIEIEDVSGVTATNKKSISSSGGAMYHAGPIDTDGHIYSSGGKIGYSVSGSVTQGTSRTTAVTLDALTGYITMFSAAVAAGGTSVFTFNNSYIEADDHIIITHENSTSANSSRFYATANNTDSGSCSITVRNITSGSVTEATNLHFTIIKSGY